MFKEVEKNVRRSPTREPVRNRAAMSSSGVAVSFHLSRDIVEKMGVPPFVKVLKGEGADAGSFLIQGVQAKTANAYRLFQDGNRTMKKGHKWNGQSKVSVSAKALGMKPGVKQPVTEVDYAITDAGVLITV